MPRRRPQTVLAAAALLALAVPPGAASAAEVPRTLSGLGLGMTLDAARAAAVAQKLPFNGCDTVTARSDGRPLVTICSHQGVSKGTELDLDRTDLQVWADGAGTVFTIRSATPISCRPEEQVGVVRDIQARYEGIAQWQPAWSWTGSDGTTALDVEMKNAEAPCSVITEIRTVATHDAIAAALKAEFE